MPVDQEKLTSIVRIVFKIVAEILVLERFCIRSNFHRQFRVGANVDILAPIVVGKDEKTLK